MRKFCVPKQALIVAGLLIASLSLVGCDISDVKAKSGLQIMTTNVPAAIYIDQKFAGNTPFTNDHLSPGIHTVEIRPTDTHFVSYNTDVLLRKKVFTTIVWKFGTHTETSGGVIYATEPYTTPTQSAFAISTIPNDALIQIEQRPKSFAPYVVDGIPAGEYHYEVSLPGFETQKNSIHALAGYRMLITVKLAKLE